MEVSIPRIRVKGCIWIVVEMNVEYTFTTRYVEDRVRSWSILLPCVGGGADFPLLTWWFWLCVIATTCRNGTCSLLTSAKLSVDYLVVGIYKRTWQRALAVLLLYLYKYNVVCATTMCLPHILLLIHHVFSLRPPCFLHVFWCHTLNLRYTYAHYVYTMRNPCSLTSSLTLTPSRLFPILLDPKSFQMILDSVTWLPGHMPISYLSSVVD